MQSPSIFRQAISHATCPTSLALVSLLMTGSIAQAQFVTTDFPRSPRPAAETEPQSHAYVGLWVTDDGHIRHELLPNGRYDEARGIRERAFQGRYRVTGDIIQYWDDTGFYADGEFRDGVLYHAGMVLFRKSIDPVRPETP